MTPACIALQGESDEAGEWLDYTVEFLATLYSPWAGTDGGWAEGPHYWMTGMAYLIEAANLIRSYIGYDLYQRPFFQNTVASRFTPSAGNPRPTSATTPPLATFPA
ncbi:DUF4962 domain-containing protein [Agrobacterium fabrum]|uniref:DUF4962 domain-containing protein n=1 Tax=Agrobacterium fabrum TaxID=1176649 RepID=UPI003CCF2C5E